VYVLHAWLDTHTPPIEHSLSPQKTIIYYLNTCMAVFIFDELSATKEPYNEVIKSERRKPQYAVTYNF